MPRVIGQFGCEEVRSWPVTFGANEKGGMDSEEFKKFVLNSIVPLFPHAKNKKGLHVMLKVDSGPGRMNLNLLTRLRCLGFILYPCAPNTTHVTQETDQLYGPFKMTFIENLDLICDVRMRKNVSLSLQHKLVGLPLFGGINTDPECHVEVSAFEQGFSKQKCVALFERIGAVTKDGVTYACLQDKQVMIAIGDGNEETDMLHHAVQTANNNAVHQLIQAGYDAEHLWATIVKKEQVERVTEPNTVAHQVALANAKGHGGRFHVTHGARMTCNDLFIAVEMLARQEERANNERKKKLALQLQDVEEKVLTILNQEKAVQLLTVKELDMLLAWHQAPKVPGPRKWTSWYNGRTLSPAERHLLCLLDGQMMTKRGCNR
jgi:hypothetical protein